MTHSDTTTRTHRGPLARRELVIFLLLTFVAMVVGAGAMRWYLLRSGSAVAATSVVAGSEANAFEAQSFAPDETADKESAESLSGASLPMAQWDASGIEIQPAHRATFAKTIRLTGNVSLNQDRIAHIYPMVEGAVDCVTVSLGQTVKADDLLVVIHSREIGEAKLELYQARLQQEMARVKDGLQAAIAKNARELLLALRDNQPITEIESHFRNRPMGDYRERLLAAYSNYLKSQADVSRLEGVTDIGAVSGKQLFAAQANRNADLATFQARIEQIDYEMETSLLLSSQTVKEAEIRVAVAATNLRILGCSQEDIDSIDPAEQGEAISHYPIRAPFDGTVITKDVVLREQVRPDVLVLSIADLSTVWITADVYEEHVPLLGSLENQTIAIHNEAWPDRTFSATVFYTGEIMDEATRTISLRAVADNPEHLLKPGMFVTVEFTVPAEDDVLQLPLAAIQEHEGQKFVFTHAQDDRFERHNVDVGPSNSNSVVIRQGLDDGARVVVKGAFILKSRMLADLMGEE